MIMQHRVRVVENVPLAERTFRVRVADREIGAQIRPGQFVMFRIPGLTEPLLGRPFALYDTYLDPAGEVAGYDLVYLVVGKMTACMSRLVSGDTVEIWGPLGNGFALCPTPHLLLVAGGIGQTPFPAVTRAYLGLRRYGERAPHGSPAIYQLNPPTQSPSARGGGEGSVQGPILPTASFLSSLPARTPSPLGGALPKKNHLPPPGGEGWGGGTIPVGTGTSDNSAPPGPPRPLAQTVRLCYGVRSAAYLAGLDDFRTLGVDVAIATDDGSAGYHGFVTDLVAQALTGASVPSRIMGCGPERMMETLAHIAAQAGVPCELSLETPMACGIGACFSCVAKIRDDAGAWDYRRVCVEGPVFDAARVLW